MPLTTFRKVKVDGAIGFMEVDNPCPAWGSGRHILVPSTGVCRCGKQFQIVEIIKETDADSTQG
jgi:hypothetical protein